MPVVGFVRAQVAAINKASQADVLSRLPNENNYRGRKLSAIQGAKARALLPKTAEQQEELKVVKEEPQVSAQKRSVRDLAGLFGTMRRISLPSTPGSVAPPSRLPIQVFNDVESKADIPASGEEKNVDKPVAVKPKRVKKSKRKSSGRIDEGRQPPRKEFDPTKYAGINGDGKHLMTTDPRALAMAKLFGATR